MEYRRAGKDADLPAGLLAAVFFGSRGAGESPATHDGVCIEVALDPLSATPQAELWWAQGPVTSGRQGAIRYACDGQHLAGVLEYDQRNYPDLRTATEAAYREILRFQAQSPFPHLLRIWNYLDAITAGDGDSERYRQFCLGRAAALGDMPNDRYPAASALGRHRTTNQLQIYWLASRYPGSAIENPRQVSAYRYPREHGPVGPSFARATAVDPGPLLISGTASIVGHLSQHPGDPAAQLEETLRNLDSLAAHAARLSGRSHRTEAALFKVYLRNAAHLPLIEERLRRAHPRAQILALAADVCRRELLVEIECVVPPA